MDWLEQLNEALNYLESKLDGEIDYNEMARMACCSTFHFQRMFPYIAGVTLSEYIRRRRMTLAAFDLQRGDKVLDVALKYGYSSPTAFNRAFQSIHGIPPSAVKNQDKALNAYPPITIFITVKGDVKMNYRIVEKDAFKIVGASKHFTMNVEQCFADVPLFWRETAEKGMIPQILELNNSEPYGLMGISTYSDMETSHDSEIDFDYFIAVTSNKDVPAGMSELEIPKCTWAIFECVGALPQAIQDLQKRIVTEWLPTSGYEYANAPDIELYFEGDQQSSDYRCEAWFPIVKK